MIAIDWGTSNCRAYLLSETYELRTELNLQDKGVSHIQPNSYMAVIDVIVKHFDVDFSSTNIVMCGMVGSQIGWIPTPYISIPCDSKMIARRLTKVATPQHSQMYIIPGVDFNPSNGHYDVMRGEEVQVLGFKNVHPSSANYTLCLPGTHSKWVSFQGDKIVSLKTHMTGESLALYSQHSIHARIISNKDFSQIGFAKGVQRAQSDEPLMHSLFSARANALNNTLEADQIYSYLSGLLIGTELLSEYDEDVATCVVGSSHLIELYKLAGTQLGIDLMTMDGGLAVVEGFRTIGKELEGIRD